MPRHSHTWQPVPGYNLRVCTCGKSQIRREGRWRPAPEAVESYVRALAGMSLMAHLLFATNAAAADRTFGRMVFVNLTRLQWTRNP